MRIGLAVLFVFYTLSLGAQQKQASSGEIKLKLKKLNVLGSVLYVAAHPDDENTRAIAYLANDRLATTAYLSMTRGDGGQNLIGPEIRDLLGLIRTQELLAARRIDGGQQFFTRANDFGFSKNYQETFEIWNKQEILRDVIQIIRQFKPDVILTRFPPDERAGHGHHTSSAILAQEAFELTNNPNHFPEQIEKYGLWQTSALYTNTGRWWNTTINENTPGIITMNVGTYNKLLGKSYSEIAAESRTQHKSQGFGSPGRRGDALEFFEYVKGDRAEKEIFEKINTTWSRIKGGELIQPLIEKTIKDFEDENPAASIPALLNIRKEILKLESSVWKKRKLEETEQLIKDCLGLFTQATANTYWSTPGEKVTVNFEVINRANVPVMLEKISSNELKLDTTFSKNLSNNFLLIAKTSKEIDSRKGSSAPYWLSEEHTQGLFNVKERTLIGKPENDPAISFTAKVKIYGEYIDYTFPLVYQWTDPVKGELTRPFEILPAVLVNLDQPVYLFNDNGSRKISVLVKSASTQIKNGMVKLELPANWRSEPTQQPFVLTKQGEEQRFTFTVYPAQQEFEGSIRAIAESNGVTYNHSLQTIQYDHIPVQTLLPQAKSKLVRVSINKEGSVIGYIKGAGDEIPSSLRNLGYEVWEMKNDEITADNLKRLDAVVLGVRALNTNERIRFVMPTLLNYVKEGGNLIVQYNTSQDLEVDKDKMAPFPITLSRDRVTEENSEVRILKPDHAILNFPNKITSNDFEDWVQERGLYFPSSWGEQYEAILSMNDKGEPARNGSLLIAKYGSGNYIYTGLSFFRELPEGVSGAYKLFANMVSLGKLVNPKPSKVKVKK